MPQYSDALTRLSLQQSPAYGPTLKTGNLKIKIKTQDDEIRKTAFKQNDFFPQKGNEKNEEEQKSARIRKAFYRLRLIVRTEQAS